jgi:serine phosphatase RsbU (regulator of sigma subunit)
VILGDVSGKGIAAALYAMKLQALFEVLGRSPLGPKRMLVEMNEVISERIERNYFITAVVGAIDFNEGKLVLARAGHNHPLHFSAREKRATWLKPNGVGIGMKTNPGFEGLLEEIRVPLEPGDVLLFYTDGVTEAMNPSSEPFGYGRLEDVLAASSHLPAESIKKELLKRLDTFRRGQDFGDDVTLVVAKMV